MEREEFQGVGDGMEGGIVKSRHAAVLLDFLTATDLHLICCVNRSNTSHLAIAPSMEIFGIPHELQIPLRPS